MKKLFQIILSVLGAFAGIQSEKIHKIDAKSDSLLPHIIVAIIFSILFVLVLLSIVHWFVLLD